MGVKPLGRSGASGFLYDFDTDQGKESASSSPLIDDVGASVHLKLTSTVLSGHNFKVFANNYFTSLPLLKALKKRQIWFAGTICSNRTKKLALAI